MWKWVFPVSGLLAMLGGCGFADRASRLPEQAFAEIELTDPQDRVLKIRPVERKATVFLFARTDCPISNRYAPTVKQLHRNFADRGAGFYLVYVDPGQPGAEIVAHREAYAYPCAAVCDRDHRFANSVGARVTPEAVVIDEAGMVAYRGRIDDRFVDFGSSRQQPTQHDLAMAIEAVLAGRSVEVPVTSAVGCFIGDLKGE